MLLKIKMEIWLNGTWTVVAVQLCSALNICVNEQSRISFFVVVRYRCQAFDTSSNLGPFAFIVSEVKWSKSIVDDSRQNTLIQKDGISKYKSFKQCFVSPLFCMHEYISSSDFFLQTSLGMNGNREEEFNFHDKCKAWSEMLVDKCRVGFLPETAVQVFASLDSSDHQLEPGIVSWIPWGVDLKRDIMTSLSWVVLSPKRIFPHFTPDFSPFLRRRRV